MTRGPWSMRDNQAAARDFLQTASMMSLEMGHGAKHAQSAELGERAARENFAFFSTFPGSGKRELLLAGLPHGSRIVVVCPKTLERVWKETHRNTKIGGNLRTWGREYAAMNATKVGLDVATSCDYLIVEEPRGPKQVRALARVAVKAPRTIVIGITIDFVKDLVNAAAVLGMPPKAMPTVLLRSGSTTPGGAL